MDATSPLLNSKNRIHLPAGMLLFGWGFLLCLYYGRIGVSGLDSSIVFDGAWRFMNGQVPFRDFVAPNGFMPFALQSIFFKLFGISWFSYCLHAAFFNGLFPILVFRFFIRLKTPVSLAFLYAFLSAVFFYPPFGVPYMDQHAFFFSFASILLLISPEKPCRLKLWLQDFSAGILLAFALLSKQIPSLFFLPLAGMLVAVYRKPASWIAVSGRILAGLLSGFLLLLVIFRQWEAEPEQISQYLFILPGETGAARMDEWNLSFWQTVRSLFFTPLQVMKMDGFFSRTLILFPALILTISLILRKIKKFSIRIPLKTFLPVFFAWILLLITSGFIRLTWNQPENGLALLIVILGLMHVFYLDLLRLFFADGSRKWLKTGFNVVLGGGLIYMTLVFHIRVNTGRLVADLDQVGEFHAPEGTAQLDFLDYHAAYHYQHLDPDELLGFFDQHKGNFLYFGDLTFHYGLAGRPSVQPWLWYHPGLTMPQRSSDEWQDADRRLMDQMQKFSVRFIVFEQESLETYMHLKFSDLPQTHAFAVENRIAEIRTGGFLIWQLSGDGDEFSFQTDGFSPDEIVVESGGQAGQ